MKSLKSQKNYLPLICVAAVLAVALIAILAAALIPGDTEEKEPEDGRPKIEETRGVYAASVYNLNFPSSPDLSADELRAEMDALIERAASLNLNTIYFQVRPACDALYRSELFPVSEYLSTSGELPLDCLEYMIEKCHSRGMALYAWVNPLRVSASAASADALADGSPAKALSKAVVSYNGILYFDPAYSEVRDLICAGIREICENYKADGIVFDDYFYPYKAYETDADGVRNVIAFDDGASYGAFGSEFASIDDFRRNNINLLVESAYNTVKEADKRCAFGVACFGIWKNGDGSAVGSLTKGMQSYADIYCDTLTWLNGGYVDFIAPQIYWSMDNPAASYKVLSKWWDARVSEAAEANAHEIKLYISHAAYKYDDDFKSGEITNQLESAEALTSYRGSIFYSFAALKDNTGGVADEIRSYYTERDAAETSADSGKK